MPRARALALVPRAHAIEERRARDTRSRRMRAAAAFEPREIEQVADDALEPMRFLVDDARDSARASRLIERQLGHRQRFDVAAHRRERRHQLVRDVGEQLPARPSEASSACARLASSSAIRLNDRATAATSSPPCSGARAVRSPAPSRSVASCTSFSRRRAGPNTNSAMSAMPTASTPPATTRHRRPELARDARERRPGQHRDAADRFAGDEDRRGLPRPLGRQRHRAGRVGGRRPAVAVAPRRRLAPRPRAAGSRAASTRLRPRPRSSLGHVVAVRHDAAVAHDDDERLEDVRVLLAHVVLQVERGIGVDARPRRPTPRCTARRRGDRAGIEPAVRSTIQTKSALCAASISARNAKRPERDAPVQAADTSAGSVRQTSAAL